MAAAINTQELPANTPILIGAGQIVEREASHHSPMQLAAQAAVSALNHAAVNALIDADTLAANIDTIAVTRLFSDTGQLWSCQWGRSNNPPQSIASIIKANPKHRIYSHAGGNQPQSLLIEFARDIAKGERDMVLIAGAEALKNQRHAQRKQKESADYTVNWSEDFNQPLEDRGIGDMFATPQEFNNGLNNVALYYALIEQAQRQQAGRSIAAHQQAMAKLLASFSSIAANNPYAQFADAQTAAEIQNASPINHLYTKRMIAQDSVNQGAAIILCSLGKAKALGIPESHYIYLHGMAEGIEHPLSQRSNPAQSPVANEVTDRALSLAKLTVNDIDLIDIYSCFPCAITAIADHLGLPVDGSRALTLTGGLPYFGGPGNNYSLHAMAEVVQQLRQPEHKKSYAMVTANGGMLSKHACIIYSKQPSAIDWSTINTTVKHPLAPVAISESPRSGTIVSYVIYPDHKGNMNAVIIGRTDQHEHFVAGTKDSNTINAMQGDNPTGKKVLITANQEKLFFDFEAAQ